jgi:hypothetical protein
LAGALAVTFGLVGVDLAHAFQEIVDIGAIHLGSGGSAAGRGGIRAAAGGTRLLILIGHKNKASAGSSGFNGEVAGATPTRRCHFLRWFVLGKSTLLKGMIQLNRFCERGQIAKNEEFVYS